MTMTDSLFQRTLLSRQLRLPLTGELQGTEATANGKHSGAGSEVIFELEVGAIRPFALGEVERFSGPERASA